MGRKAKSKRDAYGAWLYHLRTEAKLTQRQLSEKTAIPQRTISHWERTGDLTGREVLFKLAKALKVSVPKLLRLK
jgi:transcriptional regulator with XRE-family HTH domain